MADDTTQIPPATAEEQVQNPGGAEDKAAPEGDKTGEQKLFSQADLTRIIRERLADERKQSEKRLADEQKIANEARLREQGEWKLVAEQKDAELAELRASIAARETDALRATVAARHKLPEHWIGRIQGATEAEMDADAAQLAKDMAPPKAPASEGGPARPVTAAQTREATERELRGRYASTF